MIKIHTNGLNHYHLNILSHIIHMDWTGASQQHKVNNQLSVTGNIAHADV
jgi:hypothetical protein